MPNTRRRDPEAVIASLAVRQHAVVTREQLIAAGVSPHQVDWRVGRDRLRVLHRGIYLVGPVAPPRSSEMAAALACGAGAVVGHESAAVIREQLGGHYRPAMPHVITTEGDHRRPGIQVHRITSLRSDERTTFDGIPITTPARTLLDLAGRLGARDLEKALAETCARRLATLKQVRGLLQRHPRAAGAGVLRSLLGRGSPARTRSEAEHRFLTLVREAGLPPPQVNILVEGFEVDFLWRQARLIVEIDGYAFHAARPAFERDHRRDALLMAAGYHVRRFTWRQISERRLEVAAVVGAAVARRQAGNAL